MRILVAVEGYPSGLEIIREVIERPWPPGSEVRVVSVAHAPPWLADPFLVGAAIHVQAEREEERRAAADVEKAATEIRTAVPGLVVSTAAPAGSPKQLLVEEAERWRADLIVVGTHGRGAAGRFLLGSVAHAVALHAPCSVEIVRRARAETAAAAG